MKKRITGWANQVNSPTEITEYPANLFGCERRAKCIDRDSDLSGFIHRHSVRDDLHGFRCDSLPEYRVLGRPQGAGCQYHFRMVIHRRQYGLRCGLHYELGVFEQPGIVVGYGIDQPLPNAGVCAACPRTFERHPFRPGRCSGGVRIAPKGSSGPPDRLNLTRIFRFRMRSPVSGLNFER